MVSTVSATGSASVTNAIYAAASATGVDFSYLYNQARVESSLNPNAAARTSSATGLYQFIEQSWLGTVAKHGEAHGLGWAANAIQRGSDGRYRVADPAMRSAILDLRRDPAASAAMAAEFASDNRAYLEARLGHSVEPVDLYLAHFLGAAGATKFLRNYENDPDASAAVIFPAAARSNRGVFFKRDGSARSLSEVRTRFAAKFEGGNAAPRTYRRAEFASAFMRQLDPSLPASEWTLKQVQSDGVKANARLAYLMLASLGVSA